MHRIRRVPDRPKQTRMSVYEAFLAPGEDQFDIHLQVKDGGHISQVHPTRKVVTIDY